MLMFCIVFSKKERGGRMKKRYVIPVFVPHLGCPHNCIFCNQKIISGQKKELTKDEAKQVIDGYLSHMQNVEGEKEIAFFGGSFTAIKEEKQEELLQIAESYIKDGKVNFRYIF